MATVPLHRKVLILMDEPIIRNLLTLVKRLQIEDPGQECTSAVEAMSDRKQFDAIVLDLRCSTSGSRGEIHGIHKIQPARLGRVLAITAEANGPNTLDLIERYLLSGLPSTLLWLVSHRYKPA